MFFITSMSNSNVKMAASVENDNFADKKFDCVDNGIMFVENYAKEKYHPIKHCSRTTVAQYNRKIRADDMKITDLPVDAVYGVRWTCKHFGEYKSRGKEGGRNRTHYNRGCQVFVYLAWSKTDRAYKIKSHKLEHSHPTGPDMHKLYTSNR